MGAIDWIKTPRTTQEISTYHTREGMAEVYGRGVSRMEIKWTIGKDHIANAIEKHPTFQMMDFWHEVEKPWEQEERLRSDYRRWQELHASHESYRGPTAFELMIGYFLWGAMVCALFEDPVGLLIGYSRHIGGDPSKDVLFDQIYFDHAHVDTYRVYYSEHHTVVGDHIAIQYNKAYMIKNGRLLGEEDK